jgi:hypothetical protein
MLSAGPIAPQDERVAATLGQQYGIESVSLPTGNTYQFTRLMLITRMVQSLNQMSTSDRNELVTAYYKAGGDMSVLETALANVKRTSASRSPWFYALVVGGVAVVGYGAYRLARRKRR